VHTVLRVPVVAHHLRSSHFREKHSFRSQPSLQSFLPSSMMPMTGVWTVKSPSIQAKEARAWGLRNSKELDARLLNDNLQASSSPCQVTIKLTWVAGTIMNSFKANGPPIRIDHWNLTDCSERLVLLF
jgi:hypothetical protein